MSDPSVPWLVAAYAVAGVLLLAYLVRLWRAQRDVGRKLERLVPPDGR